MTLLAIAIFAAAGLLIACSGRSGLPGWLQYLGGFLCTAGVLFALVIGFDGKQIVVCLLAVLWLSAVQKRTEVRK